MEIKVYQPDAAATELVPLLYAKYGASKNFDFFLKEFGKAFNFCVGNDNVSFRTIGGYENGKLRAHIALCMDTRLPKGEAFFGFMEVSEDASTFKLLWDALLSEARNEGVSTLKGPVNGSIWHQYRCIKESDGSDFFKSELPSQLYHYDFLLSKNPESEINYYSAYREHLDIVLQIGAASHEKLTMNGFSIEQKNQLTLDDLRPIGAISKNVFQTSWGYTELTEREFLELYSPDRVAAHLNTLYVLYKGKDIIGFCGTLREDSSVLICKTICILPEYQGLGLGNALAYRVHLDAKNAGIEKMLYVLIREGNKVKNFPKDDAVFFRKYAAFEFRI